MSRFVKFSNDMFWDLYWPVVDGFSTVDSDVGTNLATIFVRFGGGFL